MNATNVVTQTLQMLGKTVEDIDNALQTTPPGADGMVFLPFLNGERTPDLPLARGTLTGLSANNFSPAHLIRAVVEGVSFGILNGLDLIQNGSQVERMLVIGGGARSAAWRQLLADSSGTLVEVPVEEEAGCLGAAMQALYAWSHQSGRPQTFAEIADRWVRVDESRSALPRAQLRPLYEAARERYASELEKGYGVKRLNSDTQ
jgi:xylulokinase